MSNLSEQVVRRAYLARRRPDPGVTMVAYLEDLKSPLFKKVVGVYEEVIQGRLGRWIACKWLKPVPVERIHPTVIGLEADEHARNGRRVLVNRNLMERLKNVRKAQGCPELKADEVPEMATEEVCRIGRRMPLPLTIRFFGYQAGDCNPYAAGEPQYQPRERMLCLRPNGQIVGVGWPVHHADPEVFVPALLGLRKAFERAHVVHKYHKGHLACDNDLFFLLAETTPAAFAEGVAEAKRNEFLADMERAASDICRLLADTEPCLVPLEAEHCVVVRYADTGFHAVPARLPVTALTEDALRGLYGAA
jgi:hypothetical protein